MRGVSASYQSSTLLLPPLESSKTQANRRFDNAKAPPRLPSSPISCPVRNQLGVSFTRKEVSPPLNLRCYSVTGPGGPSSGDRDNKSVLDAFFLGKALAEALNERVESAVGEFLSTIGRLQAEQQKQIEEFQGDVLERARRAKDQAAREALEAQGLISKPTSVDTTSAAEYNSVTTTYTEIPIDTDPSTMPSTETDADSVNKGSALQATNDE